MAVEHQTGARGSAEPAASSRRALFAGRVATIALSAVLVLPPLGEAQRPAIRTRPEQVRIAFGDDPRTSIRILWQTARQAPHSVEYGPTPALGLRATAREVKYAYQTGRLHEATLSNLRPGTVYHYRVGDARSGYSPRFTFRTAPDRVEDFVFTAFGDQGTQPASRRMVWNALKEGPALHLLLGDLAYAEGSQAVWDRYFRMVQPLASAVPFMPALGNHENEWVRVAGKRVRIDYSPYLARLALPGVETHYAFDYAGVRFVSFNTDRYTDAAQLRWLERTLAAARRDPRVRWLIVFHHVPLYSSVVKRPNIPGLIRRLQPLYDRYRVDLVLQGHNHVYERQYPLRGGRPVSASMTDYRQGEGTVYVVCGGGGDSLYRFVPEKPAVTAVRERTFCYLRVFIPARGQLVVEAKRLNGSLIERFRIAPR